MPQKSETTHEVIERELIVYRRERSDVWQCRFKVADIWQRASTKERDLQKAIRKSYELRMEAEIRRRSNLPVVTRRFRDVARLALKRMANEIEAGAGKPSYSDYISAITGYLIPILGNYSITNIDHKALDELETKRTKIMGKVPTRSTLLNHNAALNKVFDEAIKHNFMSEAHRPKLEAKGKKSERHPDFTLKEIQAVLNNFDAWIIKGKTPQSVERREVLRDYVELLIDTGARPGKELMNLKWKQVHFDMSPKLTATSERIVDDSGEEEEIVLTDLQRTLRLIVTGKTGPRELIGRAPSVRTLIRIAKRHYGVENPISDPFRGVAIPTNEDYVLRTKTGKIDPRQSFQKMLEDYLREHNLLYDPRTEKNHVFYSFRHAYATLALTFDKTPIHTLTKQMGTSVTMIERHYSHLKVTEAIDQLRGNETRRRISESKTVDELYRSQGNSPKKPIKAGTAATQQSRSSSSNDR
ncbi:MAG: hypothetical protein EB072_18520 [Betaproteobacteria bacterium]|nr:hypothetical protein [Betaproteobacteria bacterium]